MICCQIYIENLFFLLAKTGNDFSLPKLSKTYIRNAQILSSQYHFLNQLTMLFFSGIILFDSFLGRGWRLETCNKPVYLRTEVIMAETQTVKIFLASSSELKEDREAFEIFIRRQNKSLHKRNIFLDLEIWEDFIDAMSQTRLQDEYNKAVRESDIFIMLFFTKVGKYTKEEFETAFGQFQESGTPLIYTYFKSAPIDSTDLNRDDNNSLFDFKDKLKSLGHFWTTYKNTDGLQLKFKNQLEKILDKGLISQSTTPQSSPPITITPGTPDYVIGRDNLLNRIHEKLTTQKDLLLVNGVGGIGKTTAALAYINHEDYQKHYSFIAWITVTENMLEDIINTLQAELKVEFRSDATMEQQLRELIVGLRKMEGKKLLVIDNANDHKQLIDLKPTLKAMNCHILITSRCNPDEYAFLKVEELPKADAFSLFVHHYTRNTETKLGKEQEDLIYRLLEHINYHTLLVELLAKASRKKGLTLNQIKERLEQADHKHPDLNRNISIGIHAQMTDKQKQGKLHGYILTLFEPEQLPSDNQDILRLFSILPPESIPLPHLKMMSDISQEHENDFEDHLEELFQGGWLSKKRNTQDQTRVFEYKMHPLVRDVVFEKLEPNEANCQQFIERLSEIMEMHLNTSWDYIAYAQSVVNQINSNHNSMIWLNFDLSEAYRAIGNLPSALKAMETAQKGFEIEEDKDNLAVAFSRLGNIHKSMGHTEKALQFFEQYNQLKKELYDANPNSADLKNGLAVSYAKLAVMDRHEKNHKSAKERLTKAIAIWQPLYQETQIPQYKKFLEAAQQLLKDA